MAVAMLLGCNGHMLILTMLIMKIQINLKKNILKIEKNYRYFDELIY
jgi:hypothetical protein